jgi:hypothetical protein
MQALSPICDKFVTAWRALGGALTPRHHKMSAIDRPWPIRHMGCVSNWQPSSALPERSRTVKQPGIRWQVRNRHLFQREISFKAGGSCFLDSFIQHIETTQINQNFPKISVQSCEKRKTVFQSINNCIL